MVVPAMGRGPPNFTLAPAPLADCGVLLVRLVPRAHLTVLHPRHRAASPASNLEGRQIALVRGIVRIDRRPLLDIIGDEESHHVGHGPFDPELASGVVVFSNHAIAVARLEPKTRPTHPEELSADLDELAIRTAFGHDLR